MSKDFCRIAYLEDREHNFDKKVALNKKFLDMKSFLQMEMFENYGGEEDLSKVMEHEYNYWKLETEEVKRIEDGKPTMFEDETDL